MIGGELRRLAEEIASSYEARIQGIADLKAGTTQLKQEAGELLRDFSKERQDMARVTREELARFTEECQHGVADLRQVTRNLLKDMTTRHQDMKKTLRGELDEFRSGLSDYKDDLDAAEDQRRQDATEEIAARREQVETIQEETRESLKGFQEAREEMWKDLKARLGDLMRDIQRFQADLSGSEVERKNRVREELKDASEAMRAQLLDLMKGLREFQNDLVKGEKARKAETQREIKDMRLELHTLFRNLRKDLRQFKADLDRAEKQRKQTIQGELKDMSQDLRERLSGFRETIFATVGDFLGELKTSRTEGAAAWREILNAVRGEAEPIPRESSVKVEVKTEEVRHETPSPPEVRQEAAVPSADPSEPSGETPSPEGDEQEAAGEEPILSPQEGLMDEIIDLLSDHPNGLKMVEIAEKLGLSNWRSLIPVMRELVDEEEVRKEETLYFAV